VHIFEREMPRGLVVRELNVPYSGTPVVRDVSFIAPPASCTVITGPIGSGKTSLFRAIMGLAATSSGHVSMSVNEKFVALDRLPAEGRARSGVRLVSDDGSPFASLTVMENLLAGTCLRDDRVNITADIEWVFTRFPQLAARRMQKAGVLSGGELKLLAVTRALLGRPFVLLLDEPTSGLSPVAAGHLMDLLGEAAERGITLLIAEPELPPSLSACGPVLHMAAGRLLSSTDIHGAAYTSNGREQVRDSAGGT
jgi:branched-chain amino acid transport system ATP-binding protein